MDKAFAIFDMDGTLVDSMDYWRGLAREYLARQGLAPSPELLERIKPMTMTQSAELFIRTFGLSCKRSATAKDSPNSRWGDERHD